MMSGFVLRFAKRRCPFLIIASFVLPTYGSQMNGANTEGTRQLYYLATKPKDPLPAITSVPPTEPSHPPAVLHLGLRYNLLLVDSSGKSSRVSSSHIFQSGDCVSLELQANRSGYLYVLARESSGVWAPLLPSTRMPDEKNIAEPDRGVRIPKNYCFELHNPPGTERLFVVLSRDPRDFFELYEGLKAKSVSNQHARVNGAVEDLHSRFGTRNLGVQSAPDSMYVVNTSDKPTTSIVTEISIRHK